MLRAELAVALLLASEEGLVAKLDVTQALHALDHALSQFSGQGHGIHGRWPQAPVLRLHPAQFACLTVRRPFSPSTPTFTVLSAWTAHLSEALLDSHPCAAIALPKPGEAPPRAAA